MDYCHWVVHVRPGFDSICEDPYALCLWVSLRRVFPDALACVLMPDHFHVIAPAVNPAKRRASLASALGRFSRRFGGGVRCWQAIEDPTPVEKLARALRYVALNPCRRSKRYGPLCRDPLEWIWSTHRDVIGASIDPWVTAERVAAALGKQRSGFCVRYHAYVSGDPSVDVRGTACPDVPAEGIVARFPLALIVEAVAAAMRLHVGELRASPLGKTLFVHMARRHGWRHRDELAAALGCSTRTISRCVTATVDARALAATALCLGDARLRRRP